MKINIHLDDSLKAMESMPDKKYGLALVDPPYGINVAKMAYTQEDNRPVKQKNGKTLRVKKLKYKHGDWDKNPPPPKYFKELFRISKQQIIWGIKHFNLKGLCDGMITWNKCVPDGVSFNNYEHAYCSLLDKEIECTYMWAGMFQGKSIKEPKTQQGNKALNEKRQHPTQKPVILYKWLLKNYGFNKDGSKRTIFDSHFGSLSIGIACVDMGFDLDAWEIDEDYFNAAALRLYNHVKQLDLFREPIEINCNGIPIKEYVEKIDRHVKSI